MPISSDNVLEQEARRLRRRRHFREELVLGNPGKCLQLVSQDAGQIR